MRQQTNTNITRPPMRPMFIERPCCALRKAKKRTMVPTPPMTVPAMRTMISAR